MAAAPAVMDVPRQYSPLPVSESDTANEVPTHEPDFADLPDDFDQAYEWFAKAYSLNEESKHKVGADQANGDPENDNEVNTQTASEPLQAETLKPDQHLETLLNESERVSLSQFVENVLQAPAIFNGNYPPGPHQHVSAPSQVPGYWIQGMPLAHPLTPTSTQYLQAGAQTQSNPSQGAVPSASQMPSEMPPNALPMGYSQYPGGIYYPFMPMYGYQVPALQPVLPSSGKNSDLVPNSQLQKPHEPPFVYEHNNNDADQPYSMWKRPRRGVLAGDALRKKHCSSEKRRRDCIKRLIIEICALVPSLHNGEEISKSELLRRIYSFLINIAHNNKMLRAELQGMGVDTSQVPANKLSRPLPDLPSGLQEANQVVHTRQRLPSKYDIKTDE